jgi:hypothetical protein
LGEGPLLLIVLVNQRVLLLHVWRHVFLLHLQLQYRLILDGVEVKMLVLLLLNLLLLTGCEEIFIILQKVRGLVGCKRQDEGCAIKILEALDWLLSLRLSIVLLVQHSLVRLRLSFIQGILVRANLLVNALME